jgi:hypothetical protein
MERYECSNCFHIGPLNQHGGCERCFSHAVISEAMMRETSDLLSPQLMRAAVQKEGEKVYEVGAAGFWLQQRRVRFA